MSQAEPQGAGPPAPGGNAVGCALFAVGLLMLIPSGMCTALGGFLFFAELTEGDPAQLMRNIGDIAPFIALTLIPLVIGGFLVWAGLRYRRNG